jgi:trimeric autotransporter adhesin
MADLIYRTLPYVGYGSWQQPVPTIGDLPAFGNDIGDVRVVQDTFDIYEWNGTAWLLVISPTAEGIVSLNGLTATNQFLVTGTSGTDFNIASATATHTFNLPIASSVNTGKLSNTDWITFNSKLTSALPSGDIFVGNGSNIATGVPLSGDATLSNTGGLTLNTVNGNVGSFTYSNITVNAKGLITAASSGTIGNLTDVGTDGITITNGTNAVIGTGTSISQHVADTTHNGYLSSTDWNTFNNKQPAGNYITALTGDATATGPGSVPITFATVNGNVGSFGSSTSIPSFTVNAKGLITAASGNVVIAPAGTLTGTTLAANVVNSSLTSVGTITSGTWNGTTIAVANGGTSLTTLTANNVILGNGTSAPLFVAPGTSGNLLTSNGTTWLSSSPSAIGLVTNVTATAPITSTGGSTPNIAVNSGNLTDVGTDGITITNGTGAVLGTGTSISQHVADTTHNGYLASTDWNTFNNKQASGNYITALTGDVTATGPGSVAASLVATSNSTLTTLSGLTTASSLSSVGTITSGTWNATTIAILHGGTGQTTQTAAFNALSPLTTTGDIIYYNGTNNVRLAAGANGTYLNISAGIPAWVSVTGFGITYPNATSEYAVNATLGFSGANNTIFGIGAGATLSTGANTTLIGYNAGTAINSGIQNTVVGSTAGGAIVTGSNNVIAGYNSANGHTGSSAVFLGSPITGFTSGTGNIGIGAQVSGTAATSAQTLIGYQAAGGGTSATGVGYQTTAQVNGTAVGYLSNAGNSGAAFGANSTSIGVTGGTTFGYNTSCKAGGIAIGFDATSGFANSLVFGAGLATAADTATNQVTFGNATNSLKDFYLGSGAAAVASPSNTTIQPTPASGTNIAGATNTLRGGVSTGSGVGGSIIFQTTPTGTSGTTANTQTTVGQVTGPGVWTLGTASGSQVHVINGSVGIATPQTTLTGSVGTAVCSQPYQGTTYKKVVVYLNGYTDTSTQTYTYPTAFSHTPFVYGLAGGVSGATASTTSVTFTTTVLTGFVFIEGF